MESRHCGQDKRIFLCPVHNASSPCSLQAFGIRCMNWCGTEFHPVCSQTGTHMIVYPFGIGSDKNGTDKCSFTRRDLSDLLYFLSDPFHFLCVLKFGLKFIKQTV